MAASAAYVPSEVDVLGEDEGAHDGDDDHHEGAEGRGEDGAPALHHQPSGAKAQCANLVHRHQGKTNFYH